MNIGDIDVNFAEDSVVDQASLKAVGLARGPADGIRILGEGEITKRFPFVYTMSPNLQPKKSLQRVARWKSFLPPPNLFAIR